MPHALRQLIRQFIVLTAAFAAALFAVTASAAWTAAPSNPPNSNPPPPLNTGTAAQVKSGNLGVTGTLNAGVLRVNLASPYSGFTQSYVGHEDANGDGIVNDPNRGLYFIAYGSAAGTNANRAQIHNYRGNNQNIGGYIDFHPAASTTSIVPPGANNGIVRTYGKLTPTQLCLGADCRTAWPAAEPNVGGTFKVCNGNDVTSAGCNRSAGIPITCSRGEQTNLPNNPGLAWGGSRISAENGTWQVDIGYYNNSNWSGCSKVLVFTPG